METQRKNFKTCSLQQSKHNGYVLVLDVGTTGIKAFVFDSECSIRSKASLSITKYKPRNGWIEQNPLELLRACERVLQMAIKESKVPLKNIKALGITNQREAIVLWDRDTGTPVYPIIGWEDTRTRAFCKTITSKQAKELQNQTGLQVDSYFSASKIRWILKNVPEAQILINENRLAFGTIDTWLLWNLCEKHPHLTDETNAARTLLFDIQKKKWSNESLEIFDVPKSILPKVIKSRSNFGYIKKELIGKSIPILAVCGDQQASTYAAIRTQTVSKKNTTKVTFGTGVFLVQTIGSTFQTHTPFFTTLVPKPSKGTLFAIENKIEGSAEHVNTLIQQHKPLKPYLTKLCERITKQIDSLPNKPNQITIDGGVARDGIVVNVLEEMTGIPTCLQPTFDGTALGTALLVWDMM